jgi:hypothetical protein
MKKMFTTKDQGLFWVEVEGTVYSIFNHATNKHTFFDNKGAVIENYSRPPIQERDSVVIVGVNLMFNVAIKNISPEDISISADVYSLAELIENPVDNDNSKAIEVKIPHLGTMELTEDTIKKCEYVTVISVGSEYFIRAIKSEVKDNTLYINAFNTTLLNNKAQNYQKQFSYVELQEINKIIFVDGNGLETVLWSK